MDVLNAYKHWKSLIDLNFRNKKQLMAVVFRLTHKCDLECSYCNLWQQKINEMDTKTILSIIDQIGDEARFICLSGGEPLLHKDIEEVIERLLTKKGIFININSNGSFVTEKIDILKKVDNLALSLDGPKEVHDLLRGKGSYQKVINSIKIATNNKIHTTLNMVLTKYNLKYIDYVLTTAKEFGINVFFCPVYDYINCDNINELKPDEKKLRQAFNQIYKLKKEGANIGHSVEVLKHMLNWPDVKLTKCFAGRGLFLITADGHIHPCCVHKNSKDICIKTKRIKNILNEVDIPDCNKCLDLNFMETNFILGFNSGVMKNTLFQKKLTVRS